MLVIRHPSLFLGRDPSESCEKPFVLIVSTPTGRTIDTLRFRSAESAADKLRSIEREGSYTLTDEPRR